MENTTRTPEQSQTAQVTAGEASTEADLLENIWKLENLFQNHSEWLQRLEILIRVRQEIETRDNTCIVLTYIIIYCLNPA